MSEDCFSMNEVTDSAVEFRRDMALEMMVVPSQTMYEDLMVGWLTRYAQECGYAVTSDRYNNVYITKGQAEFYPCVAAHIDTVQPIREVEIREEVGYITGWFEGRRVGYGADCKTGIYVCLELLRLLPNVKVFFAAAEECGAQGAARSDAEWFKNVGYITEFDCPSKNLMSYTSGGVHLFDDYGTFISNALPVLAKYGVEWQRHPFTDVYALRPKYRISCLNLASGYYNWHGSNEFSYVPDMLNAVVQGRELIQALGDRRYEYVGEHGVPICPVERLRVPYPIGYKDY